MVGGEWRGCLVWLVRGREVGREGAGRKLWDEISVDIVVFAVGRVVEGALVLVGGLAGRWAGVGKRGGGGHVVQADAAECGHGEGLDGGEAADVVDGGGRGGGVGREFRVFGWRGDGSEGGRAEARSHEGTRGEAARGHRVGFVAFWDGFADAAADCEEGGLRGRREGGEDGRG